MDHFDARSSRYRLSNTGEFIIDDYNSSKPFSSFFPGIAGVNGIPMWVFYVNRGQCICSMGIQDKDHPIMEFQPANRAYHLVTSQGFRTFIKLPNNTPDNFYEPFQSYYRDRHLQRSQRMIIAPSHLTLEEVNHALKLRFTVEYFPVPQDSYAGLIRQLHIENLSSDTVTLEGLDGLPVIVPYGVDNFCLKNMRRTIEAFVQVSNFDTGAPFFKAKVEPDDRPDAMKITKGNFYVGFQGQGPDAGLVAPIVDPGRIFGVRSDYSYPERFLALSPEQVIEDQILESQFPCAMGIFSTAIPAGERYSYVSIIGHVTSREELNAMVPRIAGQGYVESRAQMNRDTIETLTLANLVCSGEPALDHYARQNFLDNAMRGGLPFTVAGKSKRTTLYLYSRKHGDLERDYNDFRLMPTNYSQGNGNFRDINQNRRSDLFFNPDIGTGNVRYFYNLIQLDGFNPLVLKEIRFTVDDRDGLGAVLSKFIEAEHLPAVDAFVRESFTPGGLLAFLKEHTGAVPADSELFLGEVLDHCSGSPDTDHGEGFWSDHWTYNLDLLENYQAVFPDRLQELLFADITFSYYNNAHCVQPRDEKYVLRGKQAAQFGAVVLDEEKADMINEHDRARNQVRVEFGRGDVYRTSLFEKILCLIVNKLASLDPEGVGVEMEAGKPNWYDALNGLPGIFGSSLSETLEIKRHIQFLLEHSRDYELNGGRVVIFAELYEFMDALHDLLGRQLSAFEFWDRASTAREEYRKLTRLGISGREKSVEVPKICEFFAAALAKLNAGIEKARDPESKTFFTYFRHEVTKYDVREVTDAQGVRKPKCNKHGLTCIKPLKFAQIPLPLFLEGLVHYLRCIPDAVVARELVANVRNSRLYDTSLKMYKVNASLADQPMEIGRARVFTPGWLENESIWLHMEYKYLLELLRNGLYTEFYQDFKNACIPFMSPEVYGRSILENSSFLASSAHPDTSIHGNGYVARLSGATAEFIHILLLMAVGPRPFRVGREGELQLRLKPSLPGWLFTTEARKVRVIRNDQPLEVELPAGSFSFMFLGSILVTYHNADLKDTYGDAAVTPVEWTITDSNGRPETFSTGTLSGSMAAAIRERKVSKIDIELR